MSFSFEAKNELCRLPVQKLCCARAEACGILLYCSAFNASEARIITGNPALAGRLPKLFHRAFGLRFDRVPEEGETGKLVFQITDGEKLRRIADLLGFGPEQNLALHINFALLEEDCCRLPSCGGPSSPGVPSRTPPSGTTWSWPLLICR